MESDFPKPTLAVALCISTFSLLAHVAGLAAYYYRFDTKDRSHRVLLRRQTLYSTFTFCSSLAALLLTEFSSHSPKLPLTWSFLSVVFLEADRRQLLGLNEESETFLAFSPLLNYVRPLSLIYATAASRYYSVFGLVPIIIEFSFTCYKKPCLQHRLHIYRCPMVASLMLAFLVASLVATFRQTRHSGLISGVGLSLVDSFYNVNFFWKLALDVLLFLTLPFREVWSDDTWVWWMKKCYGLLHEDVGRQMLKSGAHPQSQEELHGTQLKDVSTGFVAGDLDSIKACVDDFESYRFDDESSIGMAK